MQIHVKINQEGISVDETFSGTTSEDIIGKVKAQVASKVPFFLRPMINGMTNLAFAQEVVRRYNSSTKQNLPAPNSCDDFLALAQEQGFATLS